jgi:hypothetical protein
MKQVPASADAFVWLRLYQEELHGQIPEGRTKNPAIVGGMVCRHHGGKAKQVREKRSVDLPKPQTAQCNGS